MVDKGVFSDGFVVSEAHANFAGKYCRRRNCIHILPAGVDTELFQPISKPTDLEAPSFVYHGRLDKHRGVLALPFLFNGFDHLERRQRSHLSARETLYEVCKT